MTLRLRQVLCVTHGLDDVLHVAHRGREQRADADDVGLVLARGGHELLDRHIRAQVDDLECWRP